MMVARTFLVRNYDTSHRILTGSIGVPPIGAIVAIKALPAIMTASP
jgi:hypothetical protein